MICGIISEYNPFHNGHKYQIDQINKALSPDGIISVMSGNFVQRGEPACINKFDRTRIALANGISIVLELPTVYASSAADLFAYGACDILNKTNIVDYLCFGCESENLSLLTKVAQLLSAENGNFKELLKKSLDKGSSYPKARFEAISNFIDNDIAFLKEPNAILAIEYIKSLKKIESSIKPYVIKRAGSSYNNTKIETEFASATALRAAFSNNKALCKNYMPQNSYSIFSSLKTIPSLNDYSSILHYIMNTKKLQDISKILDITEGLENRIYEKCTKKTITEITGSIKTKRYPYSKIQRAILHIILDIAKDDAFTHNNPYIRVLGFRSDKKHILSSLAKSAKVPVITNIKNAQKQLSSDDYKKLQKEFTATDIYYITQNNEHNKDFTTPICIV